MLNKKYMIQKTFRLDSQINEDFETVCEILERTQNDLVNVAIEDLLKDNKYWLARNILVDYAIDFFYNCLDTKFEVENMIVEIKVKEEIVELKITQKDIDGSIIQQIKEEYDSVVDKDYDKKIKTKLRYFGSLIDYDSKSVNEYLKGKLNYK